MALIVTTWLWGNKYNEADVARLAGSVRRNLWEPHRFVVLTDRDLKKIEYHPIADPELTKMPGCFARLRMFDPEWQADLGMCRGDRIVCMDLDSVVTGQLDEVFGRLDQFLILQGANASNPCPFNGSLMMLRAGCHSDIWSAFSLEAAMNTRFYEFPDDQGWIWHQFPGARGWQCGVESGVYAFKKPGWPPGDSLPSDARLVVFPGWRDPSKFAHLSWVKEHWHA